MESLPIQSPHPYGNITNAPDKPEPHAQDGAPGAPLHPAHGPLPRTFIYAPFAGMEQAQFAHAHAAIRHGAQKTTGVLCEDPKEFKAQIDGILQKYEMDKAKLRGEATQLGQDIARLNEKADELRKNLDPHGDGQDARSLRSMTELKRQAQERLDEIAMRLSQINYFAQTRSDDITVLPFSDLDKLRADAHKLYLIAHGEKGPILYATDGEPGTPGYAELSAAALARRLAAQGLDKRFTDVRIKACHSADFGAGIIFRSDPFARTLARAMKKEGYNKIAVTGYHGESKLVPTDIAEHHQRLLEVSINGKVYKKPVRQSDVAQTFGADGETIKR